jgi:SAM-dependent methyltransferase
VAALYDDIGRTYTARRQSDPRIAAAIEEALGSSASILNVGAGTGSYEPRSREVVALEPSWTMIAQRAAGGFPVVQGRAEALPFADGCFDAVLAILTVHHWKDRDKGLAECLRVARSRIVLLTNDFEVCAKFWLFDYFPELLLADRHLFPSMSVYGATFGAIDIVSVPVPDDCRDGFLGAFWKRPRAYLDPLVRGGISTFAKIGNIETHLGRLERDIESGVWEQRYADLVSRTSLDLGYRLIIAHKQARQ